MRNAAILIMLAVMLLGCAYQQPPTQQPTGGNQTAPQSGSATVHISGFSFQPADITITKGTNVTWINGDSTFHTVTADDGSFNSGNLQHGDSWSFVFATPGVYKYHCSIHTTMTGSVTVT